MRHLDIADVAALACELLGSDPADLLGILDIEAVAEVLAEVSAIGVLPHQQAGALLHGFLVRRPLPHLNSSLAVLVAVQFLALNGLDVDLGPAAVTRKHVHDVVIGAVGLEGTVAWLDARVSASQNPEGEMFERFTDGARRVLVLSEEEARLLEHGQVDTGHILLALLHDNDGIGGEVLRSQGLSLETLRETFAPPGHQAGAATGAQPDLTPRARKVLELSLRESLERGHEYIGTEHLLLGLIREPEGKAAQFLRILVGPLPAIRREVERALGEKAVTSSEESPAPTEGHGPNRSRADLIALYLADIRQCPILTKDEEVVLARAIEAGRHAEGRLRKDDRKLTEEQTRKARQQVKAGQEAEQQLVRANLRLVVPIARRYESSGLALLDLIEEGNLGLMHAVHNFDWRKGFKFSTYATWWIRQAISRGIADRGLSVGFSHPRSPEPAEPDQLRSEPLFLPARILGLLGPLDERDRAVLRLRFGLDGGRLCTLAEVSERLGVPLDEIRRIEQRAIEVLAHRRPTDS